MKRIVIVSGRSGTGKTSALHVLEDLGYLCIDNLPLSIIPDIVGRLHHEGHIDSLALGIDIRNPHVHLDDFSHILRELNNVVSPDVLFLTSHDEQLLARYGATRRKHPLLDRFQCLEEAIEAEEELLKPILQHATIMLDTSKLNIHELKDHIKLKLGQHDNLTVLFQSFGFKHGAPLDTDYMFDVRMLPNPHWQAGLRALTGRDQEVIQFLEQDADVKKMLSDISQFLTNWLPRFRDTNRHSISIAIGCTGGQHRSVYLVEALAQHFQQDWSVKTIHRERKYWKHYPL